MGPDNKSIASNMKLAKSKRTQKMMDETATYAKKKAATQATATAAKKKVVAKLGDKSSKGNIFEAIRARKNIALKY
jgi:hypothetical protein